MIKKRVIKKNILLVSLISLLVITIIIIIVMVININNKILLKWNKNYSDYKLNVVTNSIVRLGIDTDKELLDKLKYDVTCGSITNNGYEVSWDLTDANGKCNITISYKNKKIVKDYSVIAMELDPQNLYLEHKIDMDSDEDLDYDNLTNKQEKQYNTDPELADTDMDGLNDDYEIFESKTDPNKIDTDDDGLSDYDEITLGLNPLSASSKNDGIKDGDRTNSYEYNKDNVNIKITGKGNIASLNAEVNSNTKISNKKGLIDKLYSFYTDGNMEQAVITISYTDEELSKYNLTEDDLTIYYYNAKNSKYEKINTIVDKENNTLTATLKHFSNYVVGDSSLNLEAKAEILFVLDNSWSMYSNEQYEQITGENYSGGLLGGALKGNDKDNLRFTLTGKLIDNLKNKAYKMGIAEFRSDYAIVANIGTDSETLKYKLTSMYGSFATQNAGTNIKGALIESMDKFSIDADNKYIVILTDGDDTASSTTKDRVIRAAMDNSVKICSIGFGDGSHNSDLADISNVTGCKYFSSSDVDGLEELFNNIETEIDDNLVDIDDDGEKDGILIADSGFIVNRDGFSFKNYPSNLAGGHCYGMATFAELYYRKVLPLKMDALEYIDIFDDVEKTYAYDLTKKHFKDYQNNLYDYKLRTKALKYYFGFDLFGETTPSDYRILNGDTLVFNDIYKEEIKDSGLYDITTYENSLTPEEQLKKYGVTYKMIEQLPLNEDRMQTNYKIFEDDKNLFNAIYTAYSKQKDDRHVYISSSDFIVWLRKVLNYTETDYKGAIGFINILKTRLNDKDPVVIGGDYSGGGHAINAISLIQDIDNPNYYYIAVYDNNYPGEKRYVDVKCTQSKCVTQANEYYSNSNKAISLTPSLEYDLEFYNK